MRRSVAHQSQISSRITSLRCPKAVQSGRRHDPKLSDAISVRIILIERKEDRSSGWRDLIHGSMAGKGMVLEARPVVGPPA